MQIYNLKAMLFVEWKKKFPVLGMPRLLKFLTGYEEYFCHHCWKGYNAMTRKAKKNWLNHKMDRVGT
jgi:hypothetical protein